MKALDKFKQTKFGSRYMADRAFRGKISIYQGMLINFAYAAFRGVMSVIYGTSWLIATSIYYFALGLIRLWLCSAYKNRKKRGGKKYEFKCYKITALMLLALDIPMGGMILLFIISDPSAAYPGFTIYASAAYTFYMMTLSIINVFKYKKLGSPILSAAKCINVIAAAMSMLGLQNALIVKFSTDFAEYRVMMNTLTGSAIYIIVIGIALYMLRRRPRKKEVMSIE